MKRIHLKLKTNSYDILVGSRILGRLGQELKKRKLPSDAVIISHPKLKSLYGAEIAKSLKRSGFSVQFFLVPEGEKSKSVPSAMKLLESIARGDVKREIFIIAFGGGVIGDLAGFVASIYKRGVPYVQVPTTFLAQIDSAIGGKAAIDLSVGKNLVGSIYQPKIVFSDSALLASLPQRQIRNGLAEAIKYGIIKDPKLFSFIERNYVQILNVSNSTITDVVVRCSQIKAQVVSLDEKETKGIRTILNFGHTLGHAIEAAGGFRVYQHGEAIALGMRMATDISVSLKLLSRRDQERINALITKVGLPKRISGMNNQRIFTMMQHDKKFVGAKNKFVLAKRIGSVRIVEGIPQNLISKALQKYK